MRIKDRQINFRVTKKEYEQLHNKSYKAKMDLSNYLLSSALAKDIVIIDGLKEFHSELRRIGVNLNQLTKLANENKINVLDLNSLTSEVSKLWQSLNSLTQKAM